MFQFRVFGSMNTAPASLFEIIERFKRASAYDVKGRRQPQPCEIIQSVEGSLRDLGLDVNPTRDVELRCSDGSILKVNAFNPSSGVALINVPSGVGLDREVMNSFAQAGLVLDDSLRFGLTIVLVVDKKFTEAENALEMVFGAGGALISPKRVLLMGFP